MNWLVRLLSIGPFMDWFRTARAWCTQYVDVPVHQLHGVVRQIRTGQVDVLFLGDSTQLFVAPSDGDRRRLCDMITAELGPRTTAACLIGPGYGVELHAEFVRLLSALAKRPRVVVVSMSVRAGAAIHVIRHPEFGHRRAIEFMRTLDDATSRLPYISLRNRRTRGDFERFEALPVTTRWGRGQTIGDFRSKLRGRRAKVEHLELQRTLFDYFHGEFLPPDHPQLRYYTELARRLREYAVPVVAYWAPIPVERGESYFPGEFAEHVAGNVMTARSAFEEPLGPLLHTVDPGPTPDDEILDSRDASEHWNRKGRRRMAALIADEVRMAMKERSPEGELSGLR